GGHDRVGAPGGLRYPRGGRARADRGRAPGGWLMLHPVVLADLLDDEVAAAAERLGDRAAGLVHDGRFVRCPLLPAGDCLRWLRLDGRRYDGEPFRVAVCGPDGAPLPVDGWPQGLAAGVHPVTAEPFACVR